jgi:hypothetical protein
MIPIHERWHFLDNAGGDGVADVFIAFRIFIPERERQIIDRGAASRTARRRHASLNPAPGMTMQSAICTTAGGRHLHSRAEGRIANPAGCRCPLKLGSDIRRG